MNIGLIILAAGGSTRLGSPKQLLRYEGQTLIRRAVTAAVESVCERVVVVIGSRAADVERELEGMAVSIVENPDWEKGMSSSIRAGLTEVLHDETKAVLIMLCDQPLVTATVLDNLVETYHKTDMPIVASEYGATRGVPALFSKELFAELAALAGDEGARRVIARYPEMVATVAFADGVVDIDTRSDYERAVGQDLQDCSGLTG
ncbi:MAG TPA: nucleotidyltransferase family protein [Pyrinomonadaceae bacterium]|jgi:molybdenum cofactor cytidylyltransferase|nr:nucleotidyltransferase family protein [Pyrinomonadaceae bacterium]